MANRFDRRDLDDRRALARRARFMGRPRKGALQRRYGAKLNLYTAGTPFTRIDLRGLEHTDAVALRDQLQR